MTGRRTAGPLAGPVSACLLLLVAGCGAAARPAPATVAAPSAPVTSAPVTTAPVTADPDPPAPPTPVRVVAPVRVRIPAIGVSSTLERLGLLPDGAVAPPADYARAGWYVSGPSPGDPGPAVIAGHVDSTTGPAVFARLGDLRPGAVIEVDRADGGRVRFVVDRVQEFPKATFPAAAVYGPTPLPELRLVTCSGDFDRSTGHYVDNLVVFADRA